MKKILAVIAVITLVAPVAGAHCGSCGVGEDHSKAEKAGAKIEKMMDKKENMTVIETAANSKNFTILTKAVEAAGLKSELSGEGPFTVFAPTDEAFNALPKEQLESLLKDKEKLTSILTYHVLSGKVMADKAAGLDKATTLNGKDIRISKRDNGVMINDALVTTSDIACSNGVIHVIDKVIMP